MPRNILAVICVLLLLASCGKRGPLEAPPGGNPNFPQTYPRQ